VCREPGRSFGVDGTIALQFCELVETARGLVPGRIVLADRVTASWFVPAPIVVVARRVVPAPSVVADPSVVPAARSEDIKQC
jgi:hypothetical protein